MLSQPACHMIRFCAYHEPRQPTLPGFRSTHGMCPVCAAFEFKKLGEQDMGKHNTEWVQMMQDGGWSERPSNGYWPVIHRTASDSTKQEVHHTGNGWTLYENDTLSASGDLTEVLEHANLHPSF